MKQYITVAGPQNINVNKGNTQEAFDLFSGIINYYASQGWNYHSMNTISITEKPGCIGSPATVYYYMLVFEREL